MSYILADVLPWNEQYRDERLVQALHVQHEDHKMHMNLHCALYSNSSTNDDHLFENIRIVDKWIHPMRLPYIEHRKFQLSTLWGMYVPILMITRHYTRNNKIAVRLFAPTHVPRTKLSQYLNATRFKRSFSNNVDERWSGRMKSKFWVEFRISF